MNGLPMIDWIIALKLLGGLVAVLSVFWVPLALVPYLEKKKAAEARRALTAAGLTPERYLATFDPNDTRGIARARYNLGLD